MTFLMEPVKKTNEMDERDRYYSAIQHLGELLDQAKDTKSEDRKNDLHSRINQAADYLAETPVRGDSFELAMGLVLQAFDSKLNKPEEYTTNQYDILIKIVQKESRSVDTRMNNINGYEEKMNKAGIHTAKEKLLSYSI
jgi:hypothetical protein